MVSTGIKYLPHLWLFSICYLGSLFLLCFHPFWLLCVCVFLIEWLTYNSVTSICNTVIHYFCTLKNDHHCKSSYHLSPHQITTLLLTVSPRLYTHLCDTLFCSGNLHLSRSLSHHPSPLANTYLFSTSLIASGCSFVSFFKFHIQVKSYYIVFSIWLFPLA